jgi:thiol-disulfide isomerase/thioredoxin
MRASVRLAAPAAGVVLGLTTVVACGSGDGDGDQAGGDPVPEAELTSLGDGDALVLEDLAEGPAVVNLWATWCVPCRQEMPAFDEVAGAVEGDEVRIVGVNIGDDPDAARDFVDELDVEFPQYLDEDGGLHAELGATGMPSTAFLDDGRVVDLHTGVLTAEELAAEIGERFGVGVDLGA